MTSLDLKHHLLRQMAFSRGAFGPGECRERVLNHITKEITEIREGDGDAAEWVDVVILGLDGLTRKLLSEGLAPNSAAQLAVEMIVEKQGRNEQRTWPDWRTTPDDKPIEHVKEPWEFQVSAEIDDARGSMTLAGNPDGGFSVNITGDIVE